jgi:ribosomal protein S18 acetylase RimI-like enzyme
VKRLPEGYALRPLTASDIAVAQALLNACETADAGSPCIHEMDLAVETGSPRFDLEKSSWFVTAPDGRAAALGWVWTPKDAAAEITGDHYVHPEHRATTLDAVLVDRIEVRAAELAVAAAKADRLVLFADDANQACGADLVARGFRRAHDFCLMRIDFDEDSVRPVDEWPAGVVVRPIDVARDGHACWRASQEAFSEHYLHQDWSYEEWSAYTLDRSGLDRACWLVAWAGDDVAGQVWAMPRGDDVYVEDLSVRRAWRGQGLGQALLRECFSVLFRRGHGYVRLFVHLQNATGAMRVYERAGMRVERRIGAYEKSTSALLRGPGRD